jgi:hypothetical protein
MPFTDWEAAHAAYIEAERKLADAETVFAFTQANEPLELRDEVSRKRAQSDLLLHAAVGMLHSGVAGAGAN